MIGFQADAPTLLLLLLVAAVTACFPAGVAKADAASAPSGRRGRRSVYAALALALWLAYSGVTAAKGLLLDTDATPPPMAFIMGPGLLLVLIAAYSGFGA